MTPEMKERVLATVNELIDCCEGPEPCRCDVDRDEDIPWYEDGPDPDYEFERRWDDGEGR